MVKTLLLTAAIVFSAAIPGQARNLAVPVKNPVATLMIPDFWTPRGQSASKHHHRGVWRSTSPRTAGGTLCKSSGGILAIRDAMNLPSAAL